MIFFVRHEDKEFTVRVESKKDKLWVKFGEEAEEIVDLVFLGNDCSFIREGKVFSANVVGGKEDYTVWRPQGNFQFKVESEYRRIVKVLRGQELGQENHVYAKMPGKIVKVLIKQGDSVEKGQSVIVMEAMKMENEIRAPLNGSISNICVREGQAVETGALLMELEAK
jgi:biotin carboxyl carrier protein